MEVNASDVMKLRSRTGKQMMQCKAALVEAGGDMEKAIEILRKKDKDIRVKSADRETAEGRIGAFIDPAKKVGALIEVRCESAPVAKNEMFVTLATDLARQVARLKAATADELLAQPFVDDPSKTVNDRVTEVVGLMRENVTVARLVRFEGTLGEYIHHDGSVGVLLQVEGETNEPQMLREVCMHVAAKNPVATVREQISQDRVAKETEIARSQAEEQGKNKPANIIDKIAEGKMKTWFAENVLAEQPFVKDETKTVGQLLAAAGLKLKSFTRFRVGEISA